MAQDKAAFVDYADASLEMCRGSLRNAERLKTPARRDADGAETLSAEEARRGVAQARMHLRGVLKVFEAQGGGGDAGCARGAREVRGGGGQGGAGVGE